MGLLCKQTNIYRVCKNSDRQKNYFDLNQSLLWTPHHENGSPCVEKVNPSAPSKSSKQSTSRYSLSKYDPRNSCRTTSGTRHFLQHSSGNFR